MKILISNDDGVHAPGLKTLHHHLCQIAEVTVIAPDRDRSAASKSLTLSAPIRPKVLENGFIAIDGTPADCVHFGLTAWLKEQPDMIVSGINAGANLGDDVLYSGTVAAATEGRFLGYPSLAISLAGEGDHYVTAAQVACRLVQQLQNHPLPAKMILNANVPDVLMQHIQGYQVTRLGQRHPAERMVKTVDPRGKVVYWIGPAAAAQDAGAGTDFAAIHSGYVSLTPLDVDMTHHGQLASLRQWSQSLVNNSEYAMEG